jgi:hypothetical protein
MGGFSGAASAIAVVDLSAKVASLCAEYSVAVKYAKGDIKRLQRTVNEIKTVLEELKRLLDKQDKSQLSTTRTLVEPLQKCSQALEGLEAKLRIKLVPTRGRTAMQRSGMQALNWPLTSKEVEKMVISLDQYRYTFSLALQVDPT